MAAATAGRKTDKKVTGTHSYPIAASTTIYAGTMVAINSSGYAVPVTTSTGLKGVGVASTRGGLSVWDNASGGNAAFRVEVEEGLFAFANGDSIGLGDEGKPLYGTDNQTVAKASGGTKSPVGRVRFEEGVLYVEMSLLVSKQIAEEVIQAPGTAFTQTYATANTTVAAATAVAITDNTTGTTTATFAAGVGVFTIPIHITLAQISGAGDVLTNYTPGYKFKLLSVSAAVDKVVTTGAKAASLNLEIGAVDVTGGVVALTSANCTPLGALVAGSAITGANTGTSTDTISIESSAVTAFVEGEVILLIKIQNMDVADAIAGLVTFANAMIADDLDNRQTINSLIDLVQAAGIAT